MSAPMKAETRLNARVEAVAPSATLAMSARAGELRRAGNPVIALSAGEPDFDTPDPISTAGIQAIEEGFTNYTANAGMIELREAIVSKLQRDNNLKYDPNQILCSNGAKQSVALTVHVLCDEGDEVLIPAPHWVSYPEMTKLAGANPVPVSTSVESGYKLTPEALDEALSEHTRLLIMCSPSNPTGAAYSSQELAALADVLHDYEDVWVLSDEIYEHIRFDGQHQAFAALPGMKERTVTVNGFSKAYAMTGWRLGYLAAPTPIADAAATVQSQFTSAPSSISQRAGVAALEMDHGIVRDMVSTFRERRDLVVRRLRSIEGVRCPEPEGAFYVFPDISAFVGRQTKNGQTIDNSTDLCFYLLEEYNVALVMGEAFGAPNGVRLSYAASTSDLNKALNQIEEGLTALQ